jgi:septal ring factor EnvC (AmiA/AmiB activator)
MALDISTLCAPERTKKMKRIHLLITIPLIAVVSTALVASLVFAQDEGHKRTEKLVKRAEETIKKIEETRQQLQKTVLIYNSIIDNSTDDARKAYRDLAKAVENCEKQAADTRKRTENMEQEAHNFFAEWTQSLESIGSENLRKRSQERLNETRLSYGEILRAGRSAGAEFDTFIEELRDQIVYLGYDLNPSAVASLKEDSVKLNQHSDVLFQKIDEVVKVTNEYVKSIQPQ